MTLAAVLKRGHALAVLYCALACGGCTGEEAANAEQPPNIVILLADDLGYADIGSHGAPVQTPNIESIAQDGVTFERFYAFPICSPSRAALLTGRSALRLGLAFSAVRPDGDLGLPREEVTIAEVLRDAGYATGIVGKWHLGHTYRYQHPNRRGFDLFYGHLTGSVDYFRHTREGAVDWQRNGKTSSEEGYATDLMGAEAARFIHAQAADRPYFLYVPFLAPHEPIQVHGSMRARYHDIDDPKGTYYAMIDALDLAVGEILRAIDESGGRENTIVLFLSDNGGNLRFGSSNKPYRGSKRQLLEGGVHVLAWARWPERFRAGSTCEQFTTIMDVAPTLAEAAGAAGLPADLDGESRLAAWEGGATAPPEAVLFGTERTERLAFALFHEDWKLIRRYHLDGSEHHELYRLSDDPYEQSNLAESQPGVVAELGAHIEAGLRLIPADNTRKSNVLDPDWIAPDDWASSLK